jgi:hypothetical protein
VADLGEDGAVSSVAVLEVNQDRHNLPLSTIAGVVSAGEVPRARTHTCTQARAYCNDISHATRPAFPLSLSTLHFGWFLILGWFVSTPTRLSGHGAVHNRNSPSLARCQCATSKMPHTQQQRYQAGAVLDVVGARLCQATKTIHCSEPTPHAHHRGVCCSCALSSAEPVLCVVGLS